MRLDVKIDTFYVFVSLIFNNRYYAVHLIAIHLSLFRRCDLYYYTIFFFFYLQVDHRSEKTDQNKSGSNYVPDNDLDPQEESTDADGGFVQLPAVCQSKSIDYDYADDNSDSDYVPVCIQCLAIFCVHVVFLCNF